MRLQGGLTHTWLRPGVSFIDSGAKPHRPLPDDLLGHWPHDGDPALLKFPIPMPSDEDIPIMQQEAERLRHDSDLSDAPKCEKWVQRVTQWFYDLGKEVGVHGVDIHQRFRKCLRRWDTVQTPATGSFGEAAKHYSERLSSTMDGGGGSGAATS